MIQLFLDRILNSNRGVFRWLVPVLFFIVFLLFLLVGWGVKLYLGQVAQNRYTVKAAAYLEQKNSLQNNLIRQTRDSIGRLVSTLKVVELDRNTVRDLSQVQGSFINRQLLAIAKDQKDLQRIVKTMKGATQITVQAKGDFMAVMQDTVIISESRLLDSALLRYDTIKVFAKTFHYRDSGGWFELHGIVTNDTVQFSPTYTDRLNLVTFRERLPKRFFFDWFRRRQTVVRYKSENPYSSLKEFQQVIVNDK